MAIIENRMYLWSMMDGDYGRWTPTPYVYNFASGLWRYVRINDDVKEYRELPSYAATPCLEPIPAGVE